MSLIWCITEMRKSSRILARNEEVADFRCLLLDLSDQYITRNINKFLQTGMMKNPFEWFANKYTYEEMLYSEKPLILEEWYTAEEINRIMS